MFFFHILEQLCSQFSQKYLYISGKNIHNFLTKYMFYPEKFDNIRMFVGRFSSERQRWWRKCDAVNIESWSITQDQRYYKQSPLAILKANFFTSTYNHA